MRRPTSKMQASKRKRTADCDVSGIEPAETTRSAKTQKTSDETLDLEVQLSSVAPREQRLALVDLSVVNAYTQSLRQKIERAIKFAQPMDFDLPTLKATLGAAYDHVQSLETFVKSLDTIGVQTKGEPGATSEAVRAVFTTPEIAEQILLWLEPLEVLQVQQTCRSLRDIINSSSKLQRHLFLAPSDAQHYRHLDPDCWPMNPGSMQTRTYHQTVEGLSTEDQGVYFAALVGNGDIKLGSRVRKMQISQPAICSMEYSASCCGQLRFHCVFSALNQHETRQVTNSGGLTVGDLLEASQAMMADHQLCTHVSENFLDENGCFHAEIHFSCKLELAAADPIALEVKRKTEEQKQAKERQKMMKSYRDAKQAAHHSGLPIPTLAEFEASRAMEERA